jgi:hypothetical protein
MRRVVILYHNLHSDLRVSTLFDLSDEDGRAKARAVLQSAVDRTSLREVAEPIGISHATLHDFLREKSPPSDRTLRLIQAYLEENAADVADGADATDEGDLQLEHAARWVRFANGEGENAAERRALAWQALDAIAKMARLEGNLPYARKTEAMMAKLGLPPARHGGTRSLFDFYDRESRAAEIRAEGARELSIAARLEAEEARARRLDVSSPEEGIGIAEQGHAAVEWAMGQKSPPTPPSGGVEPRGQRPMGGTRRPDQ